MFWLARKMHVFLRYLQTFRGLFSKVVNLVKFIILALFATFVRGVLRTKHTLVSNCIKFYFNSLTGIRLVTLAIFAVFADILGSLLPSSFPLSCYIRHFGVLASMKNSCYFCEFCGHFRVPFGFFFSKVMNLVISVILEIFVRGTFASEKNPCLLYTSPSPRDGLLSRMPSSA